MAQNTCPLPRRRRWVDVDNAACLIGGHSRSGCWLTGSAAAPTPWVLRRPFSAGLASVCCSLQQSAAPARFIKSRSPDKRSKSSVNMADRAQDRATGAERRGVPALRSRPVKAGRGGQGRRFSQAAVVHHCPQRPPSGPVDFNPFNALAISRFYRVSVPVRRKLRPVLPHHSLISRQRPALQMLLSTNRT